MLVLNRKVGERVIVGDNIVVTVVDVRGDRVRLGFTGPSEVRIHREEVARRISAANAAAQSAWTADGSVLPTTA